MKRFLIRAEIVSGRATEFILHLVGVGPEYYWEWLRSANDSRIDEPAISCMARNSRLSRARFNDSQSRSFFVSHGWYEVVPSKVQEFFAAYTAATAFHRRAMDSVPSSTDTFALTGGDYDRSYSEAIRRDPEFPSPRQCELWYARGTGSSVLSSVLAYPAIRRMLIPPCRMQGSVDRRTEEYEQYCFGMKPFVRHEEPQGSRLGAPRRAIP